MTERLFDILRRILTKILRGSSFSIRNKVARERFETAVASEQVLGRDWLRPEEEDAWKDL